jgi:hypothetical protein
MQQAARDGGLCQAHTRYGLDGYEEGEDGLRYRDRELERERDRPRYRECPVQYRRHHSIFPDETLRPSRYRPGSWRRGFGRDLDDEWRWPQGI